MALVQVIIGHVREEFGCLDALQILHDLPGALRTEKPYRIGGYVPDVYACDAPITVTIIGEAKTEADLETAHSQQQIETFLEFLGHQQSGVFVLAVPWSLTRRARSLLESKRNSLGAEAVKIIVLDDLTR